MRPYYNDPYTTEFKANVTESLSRDGKTAVLLDASYFYPTSGGQDHDTGYIGDIPVIDVIEEDGRILHFVSGEIARGEVACRVDRTRRFGNMQQHTGQHILSAAFDNLFGIGTVSSRLGEYAGTIDLSRQPTVTEITEAVDTANRIVEENRPITVHYAEPGDIGAFKLRKAPKVDGTIRIIEVADFDMSPCGGTHCTHASEIGIILTGNVEKVKSSLTRIEFFCGSRARRRYYEILGAALDSSRLLSTGVDELSPAVEKLKTQLADKESRIKHLSDRVRRSVCENVLPQVEQAGDLLAVLDLSSELNETDDLRFVASWVSKNTKKSFAFLRTEENICHMNLNLNVKEETASSIINGLRSGFGVKGGGRNGFFSITFDASRLNDVVGFIGSNVEND